MHPSFRKEEKVLELKLRGSTQYMSPYIFRCYCGVKKCKAVKTIFP